MRMNIAKTGKTKKNARSIFAVCIEETDTSIESVKLPFKLSGFPYPANVVNVANVFG